MTGLFVAGAGAGALIRYAHDRSLLSLYGHLLEDLSRMVPHHHPDAPPPAVAARLAGMSPVVEAQRKAAS